MTLIAISQSQHISHKTGKLKNCCNSLWDEHRKENEGRKEKENFDNFCPLRQKSEEIVSENIFSLSGGKRKRNGERLTLSSEMKEIETISIRRKQNIVNEFEWKLILIVVFQFYFPLFLCFRTHPSWKEIKIVLERNTLKERREERHNPW